MRHNHFLYEIHAFFISKTFISNTRLKLVKKQAKAKQRPETDFLPFENYLLFSSLLSSKIIGNILKNLQKNMYVCLNEVISLMTMEMKLKMKSESHRYGINRPKSRHVNIKCVSVSWWLYVLSKN